MNKELIIKGDLYVMNMDSWNIFTVDDGITIKVTENVILVWDINNVPEGEVFIDLKHFVPVYDIEAYSKGKLQCINIT